MTIDFQAPPWWKNGPDDYTRNRSAGVDYTVDDLIGRNDKATIVEVVSTQDIKKSTYTFVFSDTEDVKTVILDSTLGIKGSVIKVIVDIPNWSVAVTTTISVLNADSLEVWKHPALTENDVYNITLDDNRCILLGDVGEQIKVDLSGQPGGTGGTVEVTIYVEG